MDRKAQATLHQRRSSIKSRASSTEAVEFRKGLRQPQSRSQPTSRMETIAVIDFETTGISPGQGARATEIAAVLVQDGQIVGRFQSLMNSGAWVPPFIEQLTGISNAMLRNAPPARAVMREVAQFTKGCSLVAHNAAFDRGFWNAELARAKCEPDAAHVFVCTVLLSRRLYPHADNHRLGTLAKLHALPSAGRAHRALADAQVTANLLLRMQRPARAADCAGRWLLPDRAITRPRSAPAASARPGPAARAASPSCGSSTAAPRHRAAAPPVRATQAPACGHDASPRWLQTTAALNPAGAGAPPAPPSPGRPAAAPGSGSPAPH